MEPRIKSFDKIKDAIQALGGLGSYLKKSSIDQTLLDLVKFRVSQINQCAACLDMHSKDLRAAGETEQRLFVLDAWRDTPFFSPKEQAALSWAEALTNLQEGHVPDAVFEKAREQFSEEQLIELTMAVITINCYNRLNIAFRPPVGNYQPPSRSREPVLH